MKESTKMARQFILDEANKQIDEDAPRLTSKDINKAVRIVRSIGVHACGLSDGIMEQAGFRA